ncbi:MAG: hypothetical protein M1833_001556 [Piccolia ochrophora]|nr:MAG: hypothetical protein M1833_001556 [Piccolia ochrophora]
MASQPSEEEYANLQKLSTEYEPEVEGPLVGTRQSSDAISTEYANADPIFVRKTAALPQKYSHYRTVKGDGNCGWRALAFGYFETLQRTGDKNRILEEEARLKSLNNLLNNVGFHEHVYEDFVDETVKLLRTIACSTQPNVVDSELLERFNDSEVSNAIITHFRLLTSAWMKTHVEDYQPFILDGTVDQYCATQIEPYLVEIEHIGMNALIDALVKPAGLAVEILYLDRSAGDEVNSHRFEALASDGAAVYSDAPTMRLLYRPGHYDILYKIEDLPQTQVAFAPSFSAYNSVQGLALPSPTTDMNLLSAIPGMSYVGIPSTGMVPLGLSTNTVSTSGYATSPVSPVSPSFPSPSQPLSPAAETGAGSFRPSKYEYEAEFYPSSTPSMPFQTATFRNSHFNPAHFRNSDFQPELWSPDSDFIKSPRDEGQRHQ